jgi:UDP-N-acetylmuramoyl-L-alanyl-D-glutamate--2,6-diaminopimelate ligase
MEKIDAGQPFLAVVDYAHTPAAVTTLLETVRSVVTGRVLVVLGCGGDRDRAKRPLMGAAAAEQADVAVLTSDNPRSEDPQAILDAMLRGVDDVPPDRRAEVLVEPDRALAIQAAVARARPGDVVVVAGKGHETGQTQGDVVRPFDDRVVLRESLQELRASTQETGADGTGPQQTGAGEPTCSR